jgi:hypothetical protein
MTLSARRKMMGTCGCTRNGKGYQTCEWGWGVVDYDEQGMFVRRPATQEEIAACIYLEENGLVRGDLWGPDGKVGYRQERGVSGDYIVTFSADGRHMHAWLAVRKEDAGGGADYGSLLLAESPVGLWARANRLAGSFRLWQRDADEQGFLVLKSVRGWEGSEAGATPAERAAGGTPYGSLGTFARLQETEG